MISSPSQLVSVFHFKEKLTGMSVILELLSWKVSWGDSKKSVSGITVALRWGGVREQKHEKKKKKRTKAWDAQTHWHTQPPAMRKYQEKSSFQFFIFTTSSFFIFIFRLFHFPLISVLSLKGLWPLTFGCFMWKTVNATNSFHFTFGYYMWKTVNATNHFNLTFDLWMYM